MTLTKYEQSGFIIQADNGFRLAVDVGSLTPIEKLEGVTVDATLSSHIHGDHFTLSHIKKLNPKNAYLNRECLDTLGEEVLPFPTVEVKVGDTLDIGGISVKFFNVDHGPNVSAPVLENFGFLITVDGQTIYFAGDMFYASGIDVKDLAVDFALIPVGGHYTFGPQEAFNFAKTFKKIGTLIPMHYTNNQPAKDEFLAINSGVFQTQVHD